MVSPSRLARPISFYMVDSTVNLSQFLTLEVVNPEIYGVGLDIIPADQQLLTMIPGQ